MVLESAIPVRAFRFALRPPMHNSSKSQRPRQVSLAISWRLLVPSSVLPPSDDIVFNPGVVEMSILLGVHQDGEAETDEKFDLLLFEPWGGARLGSQQRTTVTIVDAEGNGTVPHHSTTSVHHHQDDGDEYGDAWEVGEEDASADASEFVDGDDGRITVVAGTVNNATLVARDALGRLTGFGGDVFDAWVEVSRGAGGLNGDDADPLSTILSDLEQDGEIRVPAAAAADAVVRVEDLGSGNYTLSYQVRKLNEATQPLQPFMSFVHQHNGGVRPTYSFIRAYEKEEAGLVLAKCLASVFLDERSGYTPAPVAKQLTEKRENA